MAIAATSRRWAAGAAVALLFALPCAARPHRHHATRAAVLALEQQWRTAQLAGDVPTLDKMLSDDYLGVSPFGEMSTKAQTLHRLADKSTVFTQLDITNEKVKLIGSIAIVTSRAKVQATTNGRPLSGEFLYTRVYQRLPSGAWKITSFEATKVPLGRQDPADSPATSE